MTSTIKLTTPLFRPPYLSLSFPLSLRPTASTSTGRGVMSISGLSYGVVRVEEPGSITSLTLQDVGIVMPGGVYRLTLCMHGNA